tara:strand:- start:2192 stop:2554 length:363 start_codon:yes stop_codon:yes gene_type:complete
MTDTNNTYLEKKAKRGWAAFFQASNKNHEVHMSYMLKLNFLQDKLEEVNEATEIPLHISNELKELYNVVKKEVSCPICLDLIPTDNIKFTSCGHKYCEECLTTLKSQNNPKCALCRRKIY